MVRRRLHSPMTYTGLADIAHSGLGPVLVLADMPLVGIRIDTAVRAGDVANVPRRSALLDYNHGSPMRRVRLTDTATALGPYGADSWEGIAGALQSMRPVRMCAVLDALGGIYPFEVPETERLWDKQEWAVTADAGSPVIDAGEAVLRRVSGRADPATALAARGLAMDTRPLTTWGMPEYTALAALCRPSCTDRAGVMDAARVCHDLMHNWPEINNRVSRPTPELWPHGGSSVGIIYDGPWPVSLTTLYADAEDRVSGREQTQLTLAALLMWWALVMEGPQPLAWTAWRSRDGGMNLPFTGMDRDGFEAAWSWFMSVPVSKGTEVNGYAAACIDVLAHQPAQAFDHAIPLARDILAAACGAGKLDLDRIELFEPGREDWPKGALRDEWTRVKDYDGGALRLLEIDGFAVGSYWRSRLMPYIDAERNAAERMPGAHDRPEVTWLTDEAGLIAADIGVPIEAATVPGGTVVRRDGGFDMPDGTRIEAPVTVDGPRLEDLAETILRGLPMDDGKGVDAT